MADWIGHLITNWPMWAIVLMIVVIVIGGLAWAFIDAFSGAIATGSDLSNMRLRRNKAKRSK